MEKRRNKREPQSEVWIIWGGSEVLIVTTYKQYRYDEYVQSSHSAPLRAASGKLDGGGAETLIVYELSESDRLSEPWSASGKL